MYIHTLTTSILKSRYISLYSLKCFARAFYVFRIRVPCCGFLGEAAVIESLVGHDCSEIVYTKLRSTMAAVDRPKLEGYIELDACSEMLRGGRWGTDCGVGSAIW